MSNSYIYCITNPCMLDYCKIGVTSKSIGERLRGLNNTSVALCFKLEYYIEVDPRKRFIIEKIFIEMLSKKDLIEYLEKNFSNVNQWMLLTYFKNMG